MRQIKEILRLKFRHDLSIREIARSCGLPTSTVGDYVKRAQAAGLSWPVPEEWTEEQIGERLLGVPNPSPEVPPPLPDWSQIHQELRRKSVTLRLLWQEYRRIHPEGYGYIRCDIHPLNLGSINVQPANRAAAEQLFTSIRNEKCASPFCNLVGIQSEMVGSFFGIATGKLRVERENQRRRQGRVNVLAPNLNPNWLCM